MSDRVPDLDLGGHFALGPWRVRRAGYGAMQLVSDGVFGDAPGSRSGAILPANRRLTVRYERRADLLTALLHLAYALVCARRLQPL